jgi:hypothetical protein
VNVDEDFLEKIFDVGWGDAEALKSQPYEGRVLGMDLLDAPGHGVLGLRRIGAKRHVGEPLQGCTRS